MADGSIVPEPQSDESEHEWSDDEDDYFPIHHAAVAGDIEEIRRLLLAGVSPDEETTYQEGEEPPTLTPICILCGKYGYFGTCDLRNVRRAGGWKRYEQAHIARLAPIFTKIFPRPRLPQELVAQVLRFCFHTGFY